MTAGAAGTDGATPRDSGAEARAVAARIVDAVIRQQRSLSTALPKHTATLQATQTRALVQELAFGTLRYAPRLDWYIGRLLPQPLKPRDRDLHALVMVGLYQLACIDTPAHVAVSSTVQACHPLRKEWACGLVNAVLRNFARRRDALEAQAMQDPVARHSHPAWLITAIREAWPDAWEDVLAANNQRPPMTLRVNDSKITRDDYLAQLEHAGIAAAATGHAPQGIILRAAIDVAGLPGFPVGLVSVQDEAAQLAARLLDVQPGQRVLDACAAPGGKTAHLLERHPAAAELVAVEKHPARARALREMLERLQLAATIMTADAGQTAQWWDGQPFDRVLLDAPCTATGVIRRHPDIKSLRRPGDAGAAAQTQCRLLEALWPLLAGGGKLLYSTCSVLPVENHEQIRHFLARHADALALDIAADWGRPTQPGRQILTGESNMDGFFYALLAKR